MAPKKKNNKKQDDDWEAELGETIAPASETADAPPAGAEDEEPAAGGLMALLRKKKEKRKKAGLSEDFPVEEPQEEPALELTTKAPVEANLDDEFALPERNGKGGKGKQQPAKAAAGDEETDASGRVLTKAEKEKAKKEREKQRKKEQVSALSRPSLCRPLQQKTNKL